MSHGRIIAAGALFGVLLITGGILAASGPLENGPLADEALTRTVQPVGASSDLVQTNAASADQTAVLSDWEFTRGRNGSGGRGSRCRFGGRTRFGGS